MQIPWLGQKHRSQHEDIIQAYSGDIYLALQYLAWQQKKTVNEVLQEDIKRIAEHMRGEREDARCSTEWGRER